MVKLLERMLKLTMLYDIPGTQPCHRPNGRRYGQRFAAPVQRRGWERSTTDISNAPKSRAQRGARELIRKPRTLAAIRNMRLNNVALLDPLRSVQFSSELLFGLDIIGYYLLSSTITFNVQELRFAVVTWLVFSVGWSQP